MNDSELKPIVVEEDKLLKIANDKSREIMEKIDAVSQRISDAKDAAEDAKNMRTGFFGKKTRKKVDATSSALVTTNAAVADMNDLIQESIKFTCVSTQTASALLQAMSYMVVHGFQNSNGELARLNETGKQFAEVVLTETENFVAKQMETERLHREQAETISRLCSRSDLNDERHDREISKIGSRSDDNDSRHDAEIEELKLKVAQLEHGKARWMLGLSALVVLSLLASIIVGIKVFL